MFEIRYAVNWMVEENINFLSEVVWILISLTIFAQRIVLKNYRSSFYIFPESSFKILSILRILCVVIIDFHA